MARFRQIQSNFTAGEISPRLLARVDLEKYYNAVETLENKYVVPHGGARRRPGTIFVAEVKDSTKKVVLIPFQFSTVQNYIIELGNLYARFYSWDGSGDPVQVGAPTEIVTPYLEAELFDIQFTQTADVLYLAHPNHEPARINRTSATTFTFTEIDFGNGPYQDLNTVAAQTLALSGGPPWASGSSLTMTAAGFTPFTTSHVGSVWKLSTTDSETVTTYVKVTAFTSSTVVTVDAKQDVPAGLQGVATDDWREGSWSDERGFPRAVTFHESRILYGGNANEPQKFWGSAIEDFANFELGVNDDDSYQYQIASGEVNQIEWMASSRVLLLGTTGAEFQATSDGPSITPTDIAIKRQTRYGSEHIQPVVIANQTIYVQKGGEKLRALGFSFDDDAYRAPDLTVLSEHITEGGVTQLAYQQEKDGTLWMTRADGQLVGETLLFDQNVNAWHRHVTKDSSGDSSFESVAVIPDSGGVFDRPWVVVKRTINGATKRYVEVFDDPNQDEPIYFDSTLTFSGASTSTLSGLSHLEGEVVGVVGADNATEDFAEFPDETVSSGAIVLEKPVTRARVGLKYTSTLKTLSLAVGNRLGTIQGARQSVNEVLVRIKESLGGAIDGDPIIFLKAGDPMDTPPPRFSGDKRLTRLGWDRNGQVTITQSQPYTMDILGVILTVRTGG